MLAPDLFNPEYHPHGLNMGEMKLGESRTAVVTIVAPSDEEVSASVKASYVLGSFTPRFIVSRLTSYKDEWITMGNMGASVSAVDQDIQSRQASGSLRVHEGQEFCIAVTFEPGGDDNGIFTTTLSVVGIGWHLKIPITAIVTLLGDTGAVLVNVHGSSFRTLRGQDVDIPMTLINIGDPRTATLSWGLLPVGVSMDDVTIPLARNEQKDIVVHLKVRSDAPDARGVDSSLNLEYSGLTRQVNLIGSIYDTLLYHQSSFHVKTVTGNMEVSVKSDGTWTWHVSLNDHAAVIGDFYAVAFGFGDPGGGPGFYYKLETGKLGSAIFPPDSSKTIDESGPNPFIRDNFFELVDEGIYTYVKIADDFIPLTVAIAALIPAGLVGVLLA